MAVTVFWLVIFQLLYSHNYAQKSYNDKSISSLVLSRLSRFQSALSLKMFNCSSRPGATVKRLCSAGFAKTKALFTRHKLTRVRPGLKLNRVSFCRVNTANPGSTRVKSNPHPEVGSTRVEPGLVWKSVV